MFCIVRGAFTTVCYCWDNALCDSGMRSKTTTACVLNEIFGALMASRMESSEKISVYLHSKKNLHLVILVNQLYAWNLREPNIKPHDVTLSANMERRFESLMGAPYSKLRMGMGRHVLRSLREFFLWLWMKHFRLWVEKKGKKEIDTQMN